MKKSVIFIFVTIIAIAVFDFYIIEAEGRDQSISAYFIRWSHEYPSFTFLFGFVMGHLFWRMPDKSVYKNED